MRIRGVLLLSVAFAASAAAQTGERAAGPAKGAKAGAKPGASAAPSPTPLDCAATKARVSAATRQCPEQARAAAQIVCSPSGHAKVLALDTTCRDQRERMSGRKPAARTALTDSTCRAVSMADGSVLAEATSPDYQACSRDVHGKAAAAACKPGVAQIEILFLRGSQDPYASTVVCPKK